ncbi:MAG: hypothetical protein QME90_08060, partial [Thermodesulfobacteriota bacterium]|nr:hypothetical protein [Thermodesulfobacteriota bacterium]
MLRWFSNGLIPNKKSSLSPFYSDFLAVLALFFSSLLFFYDLFGERFLLTERDLAPYFIPPRFFWVESLKGWDFPLWNPYQFSGHPFLANPQNGLLYPPNGFFFLFPFDIAFNAVIILHFFLAGLFTYLFLRDLKVNSTGSLISGLILMLSGYLLSVHSLLNILLSVIWTPLIMLFFRRAIERPGIKNEILTAIFMTISFLGGGIEIVYGNFFVLLFMVIFSFESPSAQPSPSRDCVTNPFMVRQAHHERKRVYLKSITWPFALSVSKGERRITIQSPREEGEEEGGPRGLPLQNADDVGEALCGLQKWKKVWLRIRSLLIISFIFLILSAIQLIPFLELWVHSIRGQGITYHEATIWSLAPKDILLFFLPDAYGYFLDMKKYWVTQCWLKTMYTGGLPFVLSLIFFLIPHPDPLPEGEGARRNPLPYGGEGRVRGIGRGRMLFLSLMLFSLFLSLGQYNPLYPFVYKYVPFFNGIRYPVKFLYIFILCLAITAGLGFERLVQFSKEREKKGLKHFLILFSLISGSLLLFLVLGHREIEHFLKLREVDFPQFNHLSVNLYHAKRFFFYLTLFFLLIRVGYEVGWKGWTRVLIVFFLIADLFGNMGFYGQEKSTDYFKKTKILEIITSDKSLFRVFSTAKTTSMETPIIFVSHTPFDIIKEKNLPSFNMIYQIRDIWGIDVVRLKRGDDLYKAFTGLPSISSSALPNLYGIKYVVSVTPIKDPRFELVYARLEGLEGNKEDLLKQNTIKLYRNKSPFQRAWLVRDFKVMDSKTILEKLASKDFIPEKEVFLEEEPPHPDPLPEGARRNPLPLGEGNRRSPLPAGERDRVRGNG